MHFEVDPSVLFKLGRDLITDDAQALIELIKNSYDADATKVTVDVDTLGWYDRVTGEPVDPEHASDALRGRLTVIDNGDGMSIDDIQRGWLTVSNSSKGAFKAAGKTTGSGRTPLGDKGLGRLGVQRLAEVVLLETRPKNVAGEQHSVVIDWIDFTHAATLNAVSLDVVTIPTKEKKGTSIALVGLSNPEYWEGSADVDLQRQLTAILSPYDSAAGLRVHITINQATIDMRREARRLLDAAPFIVRFEFEDEVLRISAFAQVSLLRGSSREQRATYERLIAGDNGYGFSEWLLRERAAQATRTGAEIGDDKYFLRFGQTVDLNDVGSRAVADPGGFAGEISSFTYERGDDSVLDSQSEIQDFMRAVAGIRVFRDGFGIRLDEDWLGLAAQQTTGSSWYGLRPLNTAGYVNLSARDNAALEETSSREAFRDTLAWRGFHDLMREVVRFAGLSLEMVRRGWTTYVREMDSPTPLDENSSPSQISSHIADRTREALNARSDLTHARASLTEIKTAVERLEHSRSEAKDGIWEDPKLQAAIGVASEELGRAETRIAEALDRVESVLAVIEELSGAAALLREQIAVADERVSDAWESVALGLSAEVLAHEVDQIADRLRGRSHQILDYLRSKSTADSRTLAYAEHVRASAAELARQVGRLNPALRFRRETRAVHHVSDLVRSAAEFHEQRLADQNIALKVAIVRDFDVRMNEGKFMQIIDNLIRNSEYWVSRQLRAGKESAGAIRVEVDAPLVQVSDSGPGVPPPIESSLFDAFVTTKPVAEGRGLGLYVVSQLIDSEGGEVRLAEERNAAGRRDTFVVDLRGALAEGDSSTGFEA